MKLVKTGKMRQNFAVLFKSLKIMLLIDAEHWVAEKSQQCVN
jgi:hypothetical protein